MKINLASLHPCHSCCHVEYITVYALPGTGDNFFLKIYAFVIHNPHVKYT